MNHGEAARSEESVGPRDTRRIVIVGPCASGKSTLATALRAFGFDARVSAQEHSEIATLWQHSRPDILIALDADIAAIRRRRDARWPTWLFLAQRRRLAAAFAAADLAIDTSRLDASRTFDAVVTFLDRSGRHGVSR